MAAVTRSTRGTRSTQDIAKAPEAGHLGDSRLHKKSKAVEAYPPRRTRSTKASAKDLSGSADSEDEIILSPKKRRTPAQTPPSTNNGCFVLDAVEITTPIDFPEVKVVPVPAGSPTPRRNPRAASSPLTLTRLSTATPPPSPKRKLGPPARKSANTTSTRTPGLIPEHLYPCLHAQKRAILASFRDPSLVEADEDGETSPNTTARQQLCDLLKGTVSRGEGNSCMLIGPRGSGKTRIVNDALSTLPGKPIVVRLSGQVQHSDRLALREIARQVAQQTEQAFGAEAEGDFDDEPNPFVDDPLAPAPPPPSHLPTLISSLPSLARPTIIVMDSFDLFALHGRQALLYCLLDTAQSCRAGTGSKGIAVVGVTTRVDTINLLEKRVKSRFSGRMLRTAGPRKMQEWSAIAKGMLCTPLPYPDKEWTELWTAAVERFLDDRVVKEVLSETFGIMRDVRMLCQILTGAVLSLSITHPYPTPSLLSDTVQLQRSLPAFPFLNSLSYAAMCLLIAANHERTAGNDTVTFEMLYESFRTQLRTSLSAPVQVGGGSIGMVRCSREVLLTTFEKLIETRIFVPAATTSSATSKHFLRYRCMVEREDVKRAVEANGQTNLKKWFSKAQ
ncbi:origin recognition complex subunit 4 C-terminus-domain-containing protein [Amylostereum chailletii]|nr:origin recognition complex subunit 4 C-terminus-domain-containing protein [Amylostereum chailletii]